MYTLEVYNDLDIEKVITYSTLIEANDAAESIMKSNLESNNTYCMIWDEKNMITCIDKY